MHLRAATALVASRLDPVARIQAVILLDYVVESVLKTLAHALKLRLQKKPDFHTVFRSVDEELKKHGLPGLTLASEIESLRDFRNLTQHSGEIPSAESLSKHAPVVTAFFESACTEYFGMKAEALSLSDIVQDDETRAYLKECETAMAGGDHQTAVRAARFAFDTALHNSPTVKLLSRPRTAARSIPAARDAVLRWLLETQKWMKGRLDDLEQDLLLTTIGLDRLGHRVFMALTPVVTWSMTGKAMTRLTRVQYKAEEVRFVYEFALDAILRIEALPAPPLLLSPPDPPAGASK